MSYKKVTPKIKLVDRIDWSLLLVASILFSLFTLASIYIFTHRNPKEVDSQNNFLGLLFAVLVILSVLAFIILLTILFSYNKTKYALQDLVADFWKTEYPRIAEIFVQGIKEEQIDPGIKYGLYSFIISLYPERHVELRGYSLHVFSKIRYNAIIPEVIKLLVKEKLWRELKLFVSANNDLLSKKQRKKLRKRLKHDRLFDGLVPNKLGIQLPS